MFETDQWWADDEELLWTCDGRLHIPNINSAIKEDIVSPGSWISLDTESTLCEGGSIRPAEGSTQWKHTDRWSQALLLSRCWQRPQKAVLCSSGSLTLIGRAVSAEGIDLPICYWFEDRCRRRRAFRRCSAFYCPPFFSSRRWAFRLG